MSTKIAPYEKAVCRNFRQTAEDCIGRQINGVPFSLDVQPTRIQLACNNTRPASPRCAPGGLLISGGIQ